MSSTHRSNAKPRPTSVEGRLIAFFEANPDEELRISDAEGKFCAATFTVRQAFSNLVHSGYLMKTTRNHLAHFHRPPCAQHGLTIPEFIQKD